jgi:hypothetical protein
MSAIRLAIVDRSASVAVTGAALVQVKKLPKGQGVASVWINITGGLESGFADLGNFDEGAYLVRAELPSGELLEETVEIKRGDVELTLEAPERPAPVRITPASQTANRRRATRGAKASPGTAVDVGGFEIERYLGEARLPDGALLKDVFDFDAGEKKIALSVSTQRGRASGVTPTDWHGTFRSIDQDRFMLPPDAGAVDPIDADLLNLDSIFEPEHISNDIVLISTTGARSQALSHGNDLRFRMDTTSDEGLDLIVTQGDESGWGIVVPRIWQGGTLTVIEDAESGPDIALDDPAFLGLASWVERGRLDIAYNLIRSRSLESLFLGLTNPARSALGAYVLNAVDPRFRPWMIELAERFEWLPDGAVAAAQMLCLSEVEKARIYLSHAFERGVPTFGLGTQKLLQLHYALDDGSIRDRERLRSVRNLLAHMRSDRLFTTVQLGAIGELTASV